MRGRIAGIYGRNTIWTEQAMTGAGFTGPWTELSTGYRMPHALQELNDALVHEFGLESVEERQPRAQAELALCDLSWRQIPSASGMARELVSEFRLISKSAPGLAMSDMTVLVDREAIARDVVLGLERLGVSVKHTFGDTDEDQRVAKLSFFRGDPRVKVTTVQSYKGWESPVLIVGITSDNAQMLYTATSRLSSDGGGSRLHVVCAAQRFAEYGRRWPTAARGGSN